MGQPLDELILEFPDRALARKRRRPRPGRPAGQYKLPPKKPAMPARQKMRLQQQARQERRVLKPAFGDPPRRLAAAEQGHGNAPFHLVSRHSRSLARARNKSTRK